MKKALAWSVVWFFGGFELICIWNGFHKADDFAFLGAWIFGFPVIWSVIGLRRYL